LRIKERLEQRVIEVAGAVAKAVSGGRFEASVNRPQKPLPRLDGRSTGIVISGLSLARELWRYGETGLASEAFALPPDEVLAIGRTMTAMMESGDDERLWPDGPEHNRAYVLAAIERLDGRARPPKRNRRLPEASLPEHLRATEAERAAAAMPVLMRAIGVDEPRSEHSVDEHR
jgi:hypothetical protein